MFELKPGHFVSKYTSSSCKKMSSEKA